MIISFEGLDCSGKKTFSTMLSEEIGFMRLEFPVLSPKFKSTEILTQHLKGNKKVKLQNVISAFALNRRETLEEVNFYDDDEVDYIFDRFSLSNIIYNAPKKGIDKWLYNIVHLERIVNMNPVVDLTFLLNPTLEEVYERLSNKTTRDNNENDYELLENCYNFMNNELKNNKIVHDYLHNFTKRLVYVSTATIEETYEKILNYYKYYKNNIKEGSFTNIEFI